MWTLSGFIDEISDDFSQQCEVAAGLGLATSKSGARGEPTSSTSTRVNSTRSGRPLLRTISRFPALARRSARSPSTMSSHLTWSACNTPSMSPRLSRRRTSGSSFFIPEGTDPDSRRDEVLSACAWLRPPLIPT